jgi:uncharacterized protein (DUF486 family)
MPVISSVFMTFAWLRIKRTCTTGTGFRSSGPMG